MDITKDTIELICSFEVGRKWLREVILFGKDISSGLEYKNILENCENVLDYIDERE